MRVSAEGQKDASQRLALQQYVHRQNISPTKWYSDLASGKNMERPGWKELQKDVFEGCVSAVLVFRLDRIARNLQDGVNVLADLCKKNVRVISISEQIDLSGTAGQMVAALIVGLADLERQAILSRIRAGIAARKANGLPTGRRRGTHPKWSLAKRRIDPLLAKFLRDQDVPLADIAAKFNASVSGVRAALRAKNYPDGP
jgi:DNA invertase Pin-like site-specific DNA recombinase